MLVGSAAEDFYILKGKPVSVCNLADQKRARWQTPGHCRPMTSSQCDEPRCVEFVAGWNQIAAIQGQRDCS